MTTYEQTFSGLKNGGDLLAICLLYIFFYTSFTPDLFGGNEVRKHTSTQQEIVTCDVATPRGPFEFSARAQCEEVTLQQCIHLFALTSVYWTENMRRSNVRRNEHVMFFDRCHRDQAKNMLLARLISARTRARACTKVLSKPNNKAKNTTLLCDRRHRKDSLKYL